jgi:hypothetical protein
MNIDFTQDLETLEELKTFMIAECKLVEECDYEMDKHCDFTSVLEKFVDFVDDPEFKLGKKLIEIVTGNKERDELFLEAAQNMLIFAAYEIGYKCTHGELELILAAVEEKTLPALYKAINDWKIQTLQNFSEKCLKG